MNEKYLHPDVMEIYLYLKIVTHNARIFRRNWKRQIAVRLFWVVVEAGRWVRNFTWNCQSHRCNQLGFIALSLSFRLHIYYVITCHILLVVESSSHESLFLEVFSHWNNISHRLWPCLLYSLFRTMRCSRTRHETHLKLPLP